MFDIDFENDDKETVIEACQQYIRMLENTVMELETALKSECVTTNDIYGEQLHLEDRIRELECKLDEAYIRIDELESELYQEKL